MTQEIITDSAMPTIIVKKLENIARNLKNNESCDITFRHDIFNTFLAAIEHQVGFKNFSCERDEPFKGYTMPFEDLADEYINLVSVSAPWKDLLDEIFNDFGLQSPTYPKFSWEDAMIYASKNVNTYIAPQCTAGLQTIVDLDNLSSSILLANIATLDKKGKDLTKYRALSVHDDLIVLRMIAVQIKCNLSMRENGFGEVLVAEKTSHELKPIYHHHNENVPSVLERKSKNCEHYLDTPVNISALVH